MSEMKQPSDLPEIRMHRPHVVILGAGCSRAALPKVDATGARVPLMQDFLDIVTPLRDFLNAAGGRTGGRNLEEVYSEIFLGGNREICEKAEEIIFEYFQNLELPDTPTLYD